MAETWSSLSGGICLQHHLPEAAADGWVSIWVAWSVDVLFTAGGVPVADLLDSFAQKTSRVAVAALITRRTPPLVFRMR